MKKIMFRIMFTLILICYMVNFMSILGCCEDNKQLDYQFCYGYFETSDEEINGYKKLMVHNDTVYISIDVFLSLSNISDIKIKCTQIEYDDLSDELKNEIVYSKNVYAFYKDLVDLNCWTFSASSNKAFCTSYYNGVTNVDLGGKVIVLGEKLSDIYIPFQALFSIFNLPYNIENDIIEVYKPVYTPSDYLHMDHLNYYKYDVTANDIIPGKIGGCIDYIDDGLGIVSDFSIHKIPDFVGEISGKIPNEKSCEELTKMLCQVDEMEKSKLLEYADVSLNSLFPILSEISEELIKEGTDIEEFFDNLTEYCNNNPTININGNEIESKYLLNFILNTKVGNKYKKLIEINKVSDILTISGKILEKYIAWATVSETATNENIINAVHSYCNNFIATGELNNPTKFKNYILDYTFYDDKELVYEVKAVPLEFIDKDMILNGNNAPQKRGLSNQIVKYINENSDKYIDEEKQKEYGYKLFIDGIVELFKDKSFDKITDLKILKNIKAIKNTANIKSAFGILNAEWNIMKLFSNEANGTFDFYEVNKMLLYANGLEQDTTNTVKAIKSNLSSNNYTSQIGNEDKQIPESKHWEDYCDLEYVRLKSYYIAHSLVKAKNEQYVKLMNSLREQELHSYTDDVPKYVRISSEEEYNEKINIYNDLIERENLILDELSDYMVMILNAKQSLDSIKSISYSKEADTELINICCQKVTGTVKDSNGKAIDDVVVNFKNGTDTYFVKSNEFPVYLKEGNYEVSISDDRYDNYISKIALDKFNSISIDIVLTKSEKNYTWHLDPTVEAEDIIVSDDSFDVVEIGNDKKESNKYSFIERNGKYNFISFDGDIILEKWYLEARIAEMGEMGVYVNSAKGEDNDFGVNISYGNDEYDGGWINERRGRASTVYYVYPYDKKTSKIYHDTAIGIIPHWGHECSNNCDNNSAILIQEADVKDNHDYGNNVDYNGKYGTAYNNKVTVSPVYDDGIMNVYNDMIALKKGNKWGYFNGKTGEQVIDFIANDFESKYYNKSQKESRKHYRESRPYTYSDGYVAVNSDKGWALYDESGNIVIGYGTFEEVRPVHNGLAWVKKDGKWGVIQLEDIEPETTTSTEESSSMETIDIYEGETITLRGTLSYEHYEINSNNSGEALILTLDKPFIAKYCKSEVFEVGTTENITSVQILSDNLSQFSDGQYVTLTGTIINAHTGHHIRSIILTDIVDENTQNTNSQLSDNEILKAVNKYLGDCLSDSGACCSTAYMASNDTNWSCPINYYEYKYSPFNYMAGSYPYYAFVDKETLKCTITAYYETVVEFELSDYLN